MLSDGIYFVWPDGDYKKIQGILTRLTKYSQLPAIKPDVFEFSAPLDVPVPDYQEVVLVDHGEHVFHGVVTEKDDIERHWKCHAESMQWFLWYRYIPRFWYHGLNLNQMFSSDLPTSTVIGLLFWIQSLVPPGQWTYFSSTTSKLSGAGTNSAIGDKALYACTSYPYGTIDGGDGIHLLTQASSTTLSANQYYRDSDDLYVRLGDGSYRENAFLVAAAYWSDFKLRLGTIDIGTYKPSIDISLEGKAVSSLDDFFNQTGLEPQFLPRIDGYTYLNLATEISRDLTNVPFVDLTNCRIYKQSSWQPKCQAVIGIDSSNANDPTDVITDWDSRVPQLYNVFDGNGMDHIARRNALQTLLDDNLETYLVQCGTENINYQLRIGDKVLLKRDGEPDMTLRIQQIDITRIDMKLTCGKRPFNTADTFYKLLRKTVQPNSVPIQTNALTNGAGTFTVTSTNYNLGGLRAFYEESFRIPTDGTNAAIGAFIDIIVNGKVIPPGRIKLMDQSSISVDITDYCTLPGSNTVSRNLYNGTGWTSTESWIKQYRALQIIAP